MTYIVALTTTAVQVTLTFTDFNCCKGLTLARFLFKTDPLPVTLEINVLSLQTQFLITLLM